MIYQTKIIVTITLNNGVELLYPRINIPNQIIVMVQVDYADQNNKHWIIS